MCRGYPHEWARHAGVPPLVCRVIFGLGVDVLWPRGIVLEGRDRADARSVRAEATDHGLPVLSDEAGAQLVPASHRSALGHARIVGTVERAQARLDQHLVHPLCDGGAAVLLEARGIQYPVAECRVAPLSVDDSVGYDLGRHLEANVRACGAVPLTITEQGASGDDS